MKIINSCLNLEKNFSSENIQKFSLTIVILSILSIICSLSLECLGICDLNSSVTIGVLSLVVFIPSSISLYRSSNIERIRGRLSQNLNKKFQKMASQRNDYHSITFFIETEKNKKVSYVIESHDNNEIEGKIKNFCEFLNVRRGRCFIILKDNSGQEIVRSSVAV